MFEHNTPVIIRGYCGFIDSWEMESISDPIPRYNILLRDVRDPRIKIVMEGLFTDEIAQNLMS